MQKVVDPLGFPEVAPIAAVLPVLMVEVGLSLRQLILVVGERQVCPAGVDVHGLPSTWLAMGRALNVPPCKPPLTTLSTPKKVRG